MCKIREKPTCIVGVGEPPRVQRVVPSAGLHLRPIRDHRRRVTLSRSEVPTRVEQVVVPATTFIRWYHSPCFAITLATFTDAVN